MIKLKDLLKELGDSSGITPYSWNQTLDGEDFKGYEFQTNAGLEYYLNIAIQEGDEEKDSADIEFGVIKSRDPEGDWEPDLDYSVTPTKGDVFKIMATVVDILKSFIKDNPGIKYLYFTAAKTKEGSQEMGQRLKLYMQYIKKNLPNADVKIDNERWMEVVKITLR